MMMMRSIVPLSFGPGTAPTLLSANDLGRGFKLNTAPGEDCFRGKVFDDGGAKNIETGSLTMMTDSWSRVGVDDAQSLLEAMEIPGFLAMSFGPHLSSYVASIVSTEQSATVLYRSRCAVLYQRLLLPGNVSSGVQGLLASRGAEAVSDEFGTKFVDCIVYGAQLDILYKLTTGDGVDLRNLATDLQGQIGVGALRDGFNAKVSIAARITGSIHVPLPANCSSFEEMNQVIADFHDKCNVLAESLCTHCECSVALSRGDIKPVAFHLASTADHIEQLDKNAAACFDTKIDDVGKLLLEAELWLAKLNKAEKRAKSEYGTSKPLREFYLEAYLRETADVRKKLADSLKAWSLVGQRSHAQLLEVELPSKFPHTGSDDVALLKGLCGEGYIPGPLTFDGKEYTDVYYEGFMIRSETMADNLKEATVLTLSKNHTLVPWLSGKVRRDSAYSVVASGTTPLDLFNELKQVYFPDKSLTVKVWKPLGVLKDLNAMLRDYPPTQYEWGARLNSTTILPATVNGWNGATRLVSITTPVLQGDNGKELRFGTCVFTRGTRDDATKNSKVGFLHKYVQWKDDGVFQVIDGCQERVPEMFVRPLPFPWKGQGYIKTMDDLKTMQEKFPHEEYEWGTNYNSLCVRPIVVTQWNRGVRIHVQSPYAMGDYAETLHFGVPCWTCETDDAESQEGIFYHRYLRLETPVAKPFSSNKDMFPNILVRKLGEDWSTK